MLCLRLCAPLLCPLLLLLYPDLTGGSPSSGGVYYTHCQMAGTVISNGQCTVVRGAIYIDGKPVCVVCHVDVVYYLCRLCVMCSVCVTHIIYGVCCVFVVTLLCLLFVTAPARTDIDSRRVY